MIPGNCQKATAKRPAGLYCPPGQSFRRERKQIVERRPAHEAPPRREGSDYGYPGCAPWNGGPGTIPSGGCFEKKERLPNARYRSSCPGSFPVFPMLRRHPHPMTIHFPIVFMFSTTLFTLLYFLTGVRSFELTALNCLGARDSLYSGGHGHWLLHLVAELPGEAGPAPG